MQEKIIECRAPTGYLEDRILFSMPKYGNRMVTFAATPNIVARANYC